MIAVVWSVIGVAGIGFLALAQHLMEPPEYRGRRRQRPSRAWRTWLAAAGRRVGGWHRKHLPRRPAPPADSPLAEPSWSQQATAATIQRLADVPGRPWEMATGEFPAIIAAMGEDQP